MASSDDGRAEEVASIRAMIGALQDAMKHVATVSTGTLIFVSAFLGFKPGEVSKWDFHQLQLGAFVLLGSLLSSLLALVVLGTLHAKAHAWSTDSDSTWGFVREKPYLFLMVLWIVVACALGVLCVLVAIEV